MASKPFGTVPCGFFDRQLDRYCGKPVLLSTPASRNLYQETGQAYCPDHFMLLLELKARAWARYAANRPFGQPVREYAPVSRKERP